MADLEYGGESRTDYSPAVRSVARRLVSNAGHVHGVASIIRHLPSGVSIPTAGPPSSGDGGNGADTTGDAMSHTFKGSPVPGEHPRPADHETLGLPGYPAHDYMAPAGSPAVSPVTGVVHKLSGHDPKDGPVAGPHGPLGWSVYIRDSANGDDYFLTHLGSRNVHTGQHVRQGEKIGTVANYAKYGTPNHIHQGVHRGR